MVFQKGQIGYNKGRKFSEETKRKISESRKKLYKEGILVGYSGKDNPMYGKVPWNKGIPRNVEERKKMSDTKLKRYSF